MFRRRRTGPRSILPPLRPPTRPLPPMPPAALEAHQQANRWMETGHYALAATIYEKLAQAASEAGHPRRATNLFVQAGRALLLAGQTAKGLASLQNGLRILADSGQWEALERLATRTLGELNSNGQEALAQQLSTWLTGLQKGNTATAQSASQPQHIARLPAKCPSCGAPVRIDEIEWLDRSNAECAYCGSVLQNEIA
ncbi:MAG: hypothetical protein ACOYYS_09655 [Chloroflexota bacterium]